MFEKSEKEFNVTETNLTFKTIYNKPYFPINIPGIKKANVLLIPNEHLKSDIGITFPETTNDFLDFLQDKADESFKPDIAVSDSDFKKYIMHSAEIQFATIICKEFVLPIIIGLITAFLYDRLKQSLKRAEELTAEITIYVQNGQNKSLKLHYKGPISDFENTLNNAAVSFFDETFELAKDGKGIKVRQSITSNNNSVLPVTESDNNDGSSRN